MEKDSTISLRKKIFDSLIESSHFYDLSHLPSKDAESLNIKLSIKINDDYKGAEEAPSMLNNTTQNNNQKGRNQIQQQQQPTKKNQIQQKTEKKEEIQKAIIEDINEEEEDEDEGEAEIRELIVQKGKENLEKKEKRKVAEMSSNQQGIVKYDPSMGFTGG